MALCQTDFQTCSISQKPGCCKGFFGPDCAQCPGGFSNPCYGKGNVSSLLSKGEESGGRVFLSWPVTGWVSEPNPPPSGFSSLTSRQ